MKGLSTLILAASALPAAADVDALPQYVSISSVEVSTAPRSPRVTVSFRNTAAQDVVLITAQEDYNESASLRIGGYSFLPVDGRGEDILIPAGGTQSVSYRLCNAFDRHYDADGDCHNAHRDTLAIALSKGSDIRFRHPVQAWAMGSGTYGDDEAGPVYLDYHAPNPKADTRPPRIRMPEGPYKAGAAALEDIRSIYDAAAYRRYFNISEEGLRPFADYLRTGEPTAGLLHLACHYNCPDLVEELLERGADPNGSATDPDLPHSPLYHAALPSFYKGSATAGKAGRIIDLLLDHIAHPLRGASPLPEVAGFSNGQLHSEDIFLHLLDKGLTLEEARISPEQRESTLAWLRYRRELGQPWDRAEARLGLPPAPYPSPAQDEIELPEERGYRYEALAPQDNDGICRALAEAAGIHLDSPRGSITLPPAESARLLAALRRARQWYRCHDENGGSQDDAQACRITLHGADGKALATPALHGLCYAEGNYPCCLATFMERYLPEARASLPPAQQIRVIGRAPGRVIFVLGGETLLNADELRQRTQPGQNYELVFESKQLPQNVRALRDALAPHIRISHCHVPTSLNAAADKEEPTEP